MLGEWSDWKSFPDSSQGHHIDAPIGPGLFELRLFSVGRQVAFGHTESVARELAALPDPRHWSRADAARLQELLMHRLPDIEYRTCAAPTIEQARRLEQNLLLRRHQWFAGRVNGASRWW